MNTEKFLGVLYYHLACANCLQKNWTAAMENLIEALSRIELTQTINSFNYYFFSTFSIIERRFNKRILDFIG